MQPTGNEWGVARNVKVIGREDRFDLMMPHHRLKSLKDLVRKLLARSHLIDRQHPGDPRHQIPCDSHQLPERHIAALLGRRDYQERGAEGRGPAQNLSPIARRSEPKDLVRNDVGAIEQSDPRGVEGGVGRDKWDR
jgi:hypothetical protein